MQKSYKLLIWLLASFGTVHLYAEKEIDLKDPFGFRFFVLPPDYKTPALNTVESEKLKWLFLEDLLVAQPQRTTKILIEEASPAPLIGALGAGYLTYNLIQKFANYTKLNGKIFKGLSWFYGFITFVNCASFQQITPHQQRNVQLTSIMKLWPHVKDRLPKEVWPALDSLHASLLSNDARRYEGALDKTLASIDAALKAHAQSAQGTDIEALVSGENL